MHVSSCSWLLTQARKNSTKTQLMCDNSVICLVYRHGKDGDTATSIWLDYIDQYIVKEKHTQA